MASKPNLKLSDLLALSENKLEGNVLSIRNIDDSPSVIITGAPEVEIIRSYVPSLKLILDQDEQKNKVKVIELKIVGAEIGVRHIHKKTLIVVNKKANIRQLVLFNYDMTEKPIQIDLAQLSKAGV